MRQDFVTFVLKKFFEKFVQQFAKKKKKKTPKHCTVHQLHRKWEESVKNH